MKEQEIDILSEQKSGQEFKNNCREILLPHWFIKSRKFIKKLFNKFIQNYLSILNLVGLFFKCVDNVPTYNWKIK